MSRLVLVLVLGLLGCEPRPTRPASLVSLHVSATELTLVPAPGARINARLKPTLELANGTRIVFDQGWVDRDSAYFAESPRAANPGGATPDGTLRIGICPAGLQVCQSLELPVSDILADP